MNKGVKIALGISIPVILGGIYWFFYRKREPTFEIESVDWDNKNARIIYGSTTHLMGLDGIGGYGAGATYDNKEFTLEQTIGQGDKLIMKLIPKPFDSSAPIKTITIDFKSKLIY